MYYVEFIKNMKYPKKQKRRIVMGQYHKVVNLDKKEYLHGHHMDSGLKLLEQVGWEKSPSTALFLLLACSNGRGGGDAIPHKMVGRWSGDRIAIIGDYAEVDDIQGAVDAKHIYESLTDEYTDISKDVVDMLNTSLN
jgi:hypothetical protein